MRIAFIDDGICDYTFDLSHHIEHYQVIPDLSVQKSLGTPTQRLSHGTLCAAIFNEIYSDGTDSIIDIAILDDTGKAEIGRLIAALEWCLNMSVKLIHMSLGTIDYFDISKLSNVINILVNNQIILVAAFHNRYIKSYPAAISGVLGVRRSKKENKLRNGGIALDLCEGLQVENCFVANYYKALYTREGEKVETDYSNSLAAPVLTGIIARYLKKNQSAGLYDVMEHLANNCSKIKGHAAKIEPYIKIDINTERPVIALLSKDKELSIDLIRAFIELDFLVSAISEENGFMIPICHYLKHNEKISGNLLFTLEYIYDPDIFFICVNKSRYNWPMDWGLIDVFINSENSIYCIQTQKNTIKLETLPEVIKYIKSYLTEI